MIADSVIKSFFENITTSLPVIKAYSEGSVPDLPYSTFRFGQSQSLSRHIKTHGENESGDFIESIEIIKQIPVQFDIYTYTTKQSKDKGLTGYKRASDFADEVVLKLNSDTSLFFQEENDVSVIAWKDFSGITATLGDRNELRATIEVLFNYVDRFTSGASFIDADSITTTITYEE